MKERLKIKETDLNSLILTETENQTQDDSSINPCVIQNLTLIH